MDSMHTHTHTHHEKQKYYHSKILSTCISVYIIIIIHLFNKNRSHLTTKIEEEKIVLAIKRKKCIIKSIKA